jgi:hypothetical protein
VARRRQGRAPAGAPLPTWPRRPYTSALERLFPGATGLFNEFGPFFGGGRPGFSALGLLAIRGTDQYEVGEAKALAPINRTDDFASVPGVGLRDRFGTAGIRIAGQVRSAPEARLAPWTYVVKIDLCLVIVPAQLKTPAAWRRNIECASKPYASSSSRSRGIVQVVMHCR